VRLATAGDDHRGDVHDGADQLDHGLTPLTAPTS
jgi:hypothetical protein